MMAVEKREKKEWRQLGLLYHVLVKILSELLKLNDARLNYQLVV